VLAGVVAAAQGTVIDIRQPTPASVWWPRAIMKQEVLGWEHARLLARTACLIAIRD